MISPRFPKEIVTILLPHQESNGRQLVVQFNEGIIPSVSVDGPLEICGRIGNNKALDLDGSSNKALKLPQETRPNILASTIESYLK